MTDRSRLEAENVADVLSNGPGLKTSRNIWVEAKDPAGHVLLGGLGAMGVGLMWFRDNHADFPGYDDAPLKVRPCDAYRGGTGGGYCREPYGHDGPHRRPAVPEVTWGDEQ